jgi:hypothetical protein
VADRVADAIRSIAALDAAHGCLRLTAPRLAAALGHGRVRWTPVGYLPDLTPAEWELAAEESQARWRPHRPAAAPAPTDDEIHDGGPGSVPFPV